MIRNKKKKAFIQKTNEILSDPELKLSKIESFASRID